MTGDHWILIVEDDADIRESLIEALQDEGYTIVGAGDGVDALDQLRRQARPPQAIILDLMMPRMSGAELRVELTRVAAWAAIPIILVTADAQVRAKAEALRAAAYLKKPVKLSQIFETLTRVLRSTAPP